MRNSNCVQMFLAFKNIQPKNEVNTYYTIGNRFFFLETFVQKFSVTLCVYVCVGKLQGYQHFLDNVVPPGILCWQQKKTYTSLKLNHKVPTWKPRVV